jgi:hypothetical protein
VSAALGQVEEKANSAIEGLAGGLHQAADRLGHLAEGQQGAEGVMGRATGVAQTAAGGMESAARYLRDADVRSLQEDLSRMAREKPLQTILVAVAAGWVVGKIFR